jgi:hypothetical protein
VIGLNKFSQVRGDLAKASWKLGSYEWQKGVYTEINFAALF